MLYSFDNTNLQTETTSNSTDEALMGRVQKRDAAALTELHRRHTSLLRGVVGRVLNNDADSEDLIQEVFVELWNRAESYSEEKGKALGWIVTLARRRAIDKLRKKQVHAKAEQKLLHLEPVTADHHSPAEDTESTELSGLFARLLSQLPDAQREALHLSFYCGMSQREIAAKTGIPLGTIKTRLELGLRKIRNAVLAISDFNDWKRSPARTWGTACGSC